MTSFLKKLFGAKIPVLFCTAFILSTGVYGQSYTKAEWSRIKMDSTWNYGEGKAAGIIGKYAPKVDSLFVVIGRTDAELRSYVPESPLSNLATDIMLEFGTSLLQKGSGDSSAKADMSLVNFGGIRASLPAGDVTPYDIISIFPFNNEVVIVDLPGKYVRELVENFARRGRVEAMSGVEIVINKKVLEKCLVAGEPISDDRTYKVVTIDFLLGGGDSVYALKYAAEVLHAGIYMRDVIIDYFKRESEAGRTITSEKDGRSVLIR